MPTMYTSPNKHGETERVGSIEVTHNFVSAPGAVIPIDWHFVEAGEKTAETILFLHGNPESWVAWHPQIKHFADRYHIIAPDLKGYGQGDKRPGDWRWENVAEEMLALLDKIGLTKFHIVAHDRGCVLADYMAGNHSERLLSYVRMQQICHILRLENSPQSVYLADPIFGPNIYGNPDFYFKFRLQKMLKNPVKQELLDLLKAQMRFPGMNTAVIRYFQSSSFEKERLDRTSRLFKNMHFPVLLLQAADDDGQPPFYYNDPTNPAVAQFPNARLQFIENCGHYSNLEKPEQVTAAIESMLQYVRKGE
ncbi:alpha/beta hydrolase BbdC (plasmid) [Aminobacter sp. MSH1]|uniref:alpha/beta fold hydrolase n=1 Tax=Aminobacter sp. MSH1 TaxID=374606 RepID=UPI0009DC7274|nr:alpha/beta hydrolase [Aminobacter sp. MSH1]ARD70010.1 alpha/beta hydrolase BbdC [Aminobacter sp. MSH1]